MEAEPQHNVNNDSNNAEAVTRTHSNEEAPFTVDDLQSELSSIPNLAEMHQSSATPASQPISNASNLDAKALGPFTNDSPQALWTSSAAAAEAAAHSDDHTVLATSAERAEGHDRVADSPPTEQAEQQKIQTPSVDATAAATTGYSHASLQAANTSPEAVAHPQQPPAAQKQDIPAEEHPTSNTEAGTGRIVQEDAAALGPSNDGSPLSTSSIHPDENHAAPQALMMNAPTSESSADAPTAGSAPQPAMSRDARPSSGQLHMHSLEQQGDSSWGSDAFPDETTHVEAAAATGSTEASTEADTDADLERASVQAQGQLEGGDRADVAERHQASTTDSLHHSTTTAISHTSTDQNEPRWETQANDSSWADGKFAKFSASLNTEAPSDGAITGAPASEGFEVPTESSISQHSPVMPKEPLTDESHRADNAFAAATAVPDAEQTAPLAPSSETQAAVAGIGDPDDSVAQATAASSEAPPVEPSAPDAKAPKSTEAVSEADAAATGKADTAAGANVAEQPGKQQALEDKWGDDDDDFGDFNDAGDDGDDGGFGAFNEASAETPRSADASVQSPESQSKALQPSSMPPGMCKQDCCCCTSLNLSLCQV